MHGIFQGFCRRVMVSLFEKCVNERTILFEKLNRGCVCGDGRESDAADEDENGRTSKRQKKLTSVGFTTVKKKSEDIESSGKGRCKFFQARKLELLTQF